MELDCQQLHIYITKLHDLIAAPVPRAALSEMLKLFPKGSFGEFAFDELMQPVNTDVTFTMDVSTDSPNAAGSTERVVGGWQRGV